MSFRCDNCHEPQSAGTKPYKVVLQTRKKSYPARTARNGAIIDNGGTGREIVREVKLCLKCRDVELLRESDKGHKEGEGTDAE